MIFLSTSLVFHLVLLQNDNFLILAVSSLLKPSRPVASERGKDDVLGSASPPKQLITKKYAIPALMKSTNVW